MLRVTVQVPDLSRLTAGLEDRIDRAVGETAEATVNDIRASMAGPKSGMLYKRGKRGMHQASAPGEAPAIDMSNLVNSLRAHKLGRMKWGISENIIGRHLEYGTRTIAPRPHIRPAAERARNVLVTKVKEALKL